jgi:hypothetical protein
MDIALFLQIKEEYTEHLVNTIAPYIYEGLSSIYKEAARIALDANQFNKTLVIFQKLLQSIPDWNQQRILEETTRIMQSSGTSAYLDNLVKAVIKSNIILLTYSNNISNIIAQTFYDTFSTAQFIHQCYIECAKDAHNNPYLFLFNPDSDSQSLLEYKRNQILIQNKIDDGITRAVRKVLPISSILKEFLVNSVNIIQEPSKIELIGDHCNNNIQPPSYQSVIENINPPQVVKIPSENKISTNIKKDTVSVHKVDPELEKEVRKLINCESNKSEKDKIMDLMKIEAIVNSIHSGDSSKKNRSDIQEYMYQMPYSTVFSSQHRNTETNYSGSMPKNLYDNLPATRKSDNEIINISNNPTNYNQTSHSITSLRTLADIPKRQEIVSERVDPTQVQLIEEFGMSPTFKKKSGKKRH